MTPEERNLITGLFDRLRNADANAPAKDREAEELIRQLTAQVPGAAYLLTQTTLVQEHALTNAQARIQTLEKQLAQAQQQQPAASGTSGGFLSGLFGSHSSTPPPQQTPPPVPVQAPPYPSTVNMAPSAGGGFLRNALGAAAGVAGGAMLFQGIQNLLGHNSGPFGSFGGGGGGGFLGGGGGSHSDVVNNYYGDSAGERRQEGAGGSADGGEDQQFTGGAELGSAIPEGVADQPAHPGYEDARSDGSTFDTSNPFDKPVDDNSFFGGGGGSLDNNYDSDNTDAGSSDFVGGDSDSGNDDSSYV